MATSRIGPCSHFLADFSAFVDDVLPAPRRAGLQAHLDCCEPCLRHLRAYRRGLATYRRLQDEAAPGLWAGVEQRIDGLEGIEAERFAPAPESRLPAVGLAVGTVLALVVVWASDPNTRVRSAESTLNPVSIASVLPVVADPAVTRGRPAAGRVAISRRSESVPAVLQMALVPPEETDFGAEPIEIREVEMRIIRASVPLPWPAEAALSLP